MTQIRKKINQSNRTFSPLEKEVIQDVIRAFPKSVLTADAKHLLGALVSFYNPEWGYAFPTYDQLEQACGCSRDTIGRTLKTLCPPPPKKDGEKIEAEKFFVDRKRRSNKKDGYDNNTYSINFGKIIQDADLGMFKDRTGKREILLKLKAETDAKPAATDARQSQKIGLSLVRGSDSNRSEDRSLYRLQAVDTLSEDTDSPRSVADRSDLDAFGDNGPSDQTGRGYDKQASVRKAGFLSPVNESAPADWPCEFSKLALAECPKSNHTSEPAFRKAMNDLRKAGQSFEDIMTGIRYVREREDQKAVWNGEDDPEYVPGANVIVTGYLEDWRDDHDWIRGNRPDLCKHPPVSDSPANDNRRFSERDDPNDQLLAI